MEMFGLNALETNKMDVCGFGGQQPADITSYMYLPTRPNGKGSDATSSANLIPDLSDNYLPQVYDPVGATDILTAAVQEIQYTDENEKLFYSKSLIPSRFIYLKERYCTNSNGVERSIISVIG